MFFAVGGRAPPVCQRDGPSLRSVAFKSWNPWRGMAFVSVVGMKKTSLFAVLAFTALACASATVASGCEKDEEKDEEKDNRECEADCVAEYAAEIEQCESDVAECLSTCDGLDDSDCTEECEDMSFDCQVDYFICVVSCPCVAEVGSCGRDCGEDVECATACFDGYDECAGEDSPHICATNCYVPRDECTFECDEMGYNSADFESCREACTVETASCMRDCD